MDLDQEVIDTSPSDPGIDYSELANEALNEIKAETSQAKAATKEVKRDLTPEEILRSYQKTKVEDEIIEDESDEMVEQPEVKAKSEEEVTDDEELLDLIYKGEVEPTPRSEVIKLAQMGKDYTAKTQALAKERQDFQTTSLKQKQELDNMRQEFDTASKDFHETKENFTKLQFAFDILKNSNPDLYEEMDKAVASVINQYDNPVIRRQMEASNTKLKTLEDQIAAMSNEGIKTKYFAEEKTVKAEFENSLAEVGVIVDWQKVKEAYANGAETAKAALFAVYGPEITQAYQSKTKLMNVRNQASRQSVKPTMKNSSKGVAQPKNYGKMGWHDIINDALSGIS